MTEKETEWEARERCGEKPFDKIEEIIKAFEDKRKKEWHYLDVGNEYTEMIKNFLRQSLRQYRQSIEEEMIKSFREGKICAYCGQAKEPNLTELCNECLEEN